MTSLSENQQTQFIPLNKLKKSPRNVRQMPHSKAHIATLADSIQAHGLLQNLVVETEVDNKGRATGCYFVTAGEGRRLALLLRVKCKHIKANEPIRCVVDDTHNAQALSLAENVLHEPMHAADQFEAFKQLIDGGQSIEEVAGQFGVTPLVVQRRLKLANVAPEFIALYRKGGKGGLTLDHLMAFAVTDDHAKQRQAWKSLPKYNRDADSVRRALTENEISVREAIVQFVGLNNYENAGGPIRRDLFAEHQEDGFVMDTELLRKLAGEKLEKAAAQLKEQGHAWVEVIPELDYSTLSTFGRVQTVLREATVKEQQKLDALTKELAGIEAQQANTGEDDEDRFSALADKADEVETKIRAVNEKRRVADPVQQALAGAVVSIGRDGELDIKEGLLKPEDAKRFARARKAAMKSSEPSAPRVHSASLVRRLTAQKTLALQATLADRPDVAMIALTHRLVMRTFFSAGHSADNVVQIDPQKPNLEGYAGDVAGCKAHVALAERHESLRLQLPEDPAALFAWLQRQPQDKIMSLCAYCVASTLNGVSTDEGSHALDALANAAGLDMRQWWAATAQSYLTSVPKARILDVVKQAVSQEAASSLAELKKDVLVREAEKKLADTGWLPEVLQTKAA